MSAEEGKQAVLALIGGRDPERTLGEMRERHARQPPPVRDASATYDVLGRKQFRRSSIWWLMRWIPGLVDRVAVVPPGAIPEQGTDENGSFSFIQCPCGARPVARPEIEKCVGCERYYVVTPDAGKVIVAYGDMPIPGAPASE